MKLYLGISGKMCVGKSTLTKGITEALGNLKVSTVSLAKPIKDLQNNIYKDLDLVMEGEKDRDLLIALGMWGRNKDSDFWLKQAIKQLESSDSHIVICDDVRFQNEAEWFSKNGLLIRLEGEQRGDNVDESRKNDVTETNLDDYPFEHVIHNNDGIEPTLMSALYSIATHIKVSDELVDSIVQEVHKED